ncbi:hydrolase of the metallo-beta-lactamase superfamily [Cenarchaeum symbiosum A]|uniref:Hydrolase of the metallo-beta-lactamase superfamily n=1 Tax=Cenarchaeum symbiosum (strain A) TaxID=414004 RepID=A0RTJ7_CENSY|nr:hydrolase of the metallo-beta-lactamase superfamily [Cenarchaeum symbiosum A]
MTQLEFYGGIKEIGGNKILVEDKGTRVFLDFGMQMGRANDYFAEFMKPRTLNGMGDLFEFDLLPQLDGIYRKDYAKHMGLKHWDSETSVDAVLLSHAHVDHCAYIKYLRPEIPVYCTEATKMILQVFDDAGMGEEYITYKRNFGFHKKNGVGIKTIGKKRETKPRDIRLIKNLEKFKVGNIEVEPIAIDHSLPGACGFLMHTSSGTLGYTADIRFHGRHPDDSQKFVDRCGSEKPDCLLCEGTRIDVPKSDLTEIEIESKARTMMEDTKGLVVCSYPPRDLDRMLSFYNAAKAAGRVLAIDTRQAYLLKLFDESEECRGLFPSPKDPSIRVYLSRKKWGLIDKDPDYWTKKLVREDYKAWEHEFLSYDNAVDYRDISKKQNDYVFHCSDFKLQELIDVRPDEGSRYIRSSTEPFDEEMELDQVRVKRWLGKFGLIGSDNKWETLHVSGHGTHDQIKGVIDGSASKMLIPIHTNKEDHFDALHNNVRKVNLGDTLHL